ncbi:MAG: SDR family oxidoreductase [Candidatus Neomarinimicrobiota bacterium]|nr:SDR family oxidoreductase [Candidatus Neomarinimicrobiota bacterium]
MNLKDKNIIITGGANGIGKALADRFLKESPNSIHLIDINPDVLHVADSIGAEAYITDVANEEQFAIVLNQIIKDVGSIDIFCSNAGVDGHGTLDAGNDTWDHNWQVNVMSHIYAARILIPHMLENKDGYFLLTVSAAGLLNMPGAMPYATTKHAAIGLAENLSIMYGNQGIKVSALCPQLVDTNMLQTSKLPPDDHPLMMDGILTTEQVADCTVEGINEEKFLILPHENVLRYIQGKTYDYDKWIEGIKKQVVKLK